MTPPLPPPLTLSKNQLLRFLSIYTSKIARKPLYVAKLRRHVAMNMSKSWPIPLVPKLSKVTTHYIIRYHTTRTKEITFFYPKGAISFLKYAQTMAIFGLECSRCHGFSNPLFFDPTLYSVLLSTYTGTTNVVWHHQ